MSNVKSLTVHKNTKEKRERREIWQALQGAAKSIDKNIDGYALVTFSHDRTDMTRWGYWRVRDAADTARLPDIAKSTVEQSIRNSADD